MTMTDVTNVTIDNAISDSAIVPNKASGIVWINPWACELVSVFQSIVFFQIWRNPVACVFFKLTIKPVSGSFNFK